MGDVLSIPQTNQRVSRLSASLIDAIQEELERGDLSLAELSGCLDVVKSHYMINAWMQTQLDEPE